MKLNYLPMLAAVGFAVALARPCAADQTVVTPTSQSNNQNTPPLASAPPSYVWDGQDYVGKSGGRYYYLGPQNTWVAMTPAQEYRYEEWQTNNPDWQQHEIRNTHYRGHDQGQSATPNTTAEPNGQDTQPNYQPAPPPANPNPNNPPQ